jgi:hypothetical protein
MEETLERLIESLVSVSDGLPGGDRRDGAAGDADIREYHLERIDFDDLRETLSHTEQVLRELLSLTRDCTAARRLITTRIAALRRAGAALAGNRAAAGPEEPAVPEGLLALVHRYTEEQAILKRLAGAPVVETAAQRRTMLEFRS